MKKLLFWKREKKKPRNILGFEISEKPDPKNKKELKESEAEAFLKALKTANFGGFVEYLSSPWRIFWSNVLGGIARGLGIVIGMTVVLAVLISISGWFVDFPLIGQYFTDFKQALENFSSVQTR